MQEWPEQNCASPAWVNEPGPSVVAPAPVPELGLVELVVVEFVLVELVVVEFGLVELVVVEFVLVELVVVEFVLVVEFVKPVAPGGLEELELAPPANQACGEQSSNKKRSEVTNAKHTVLHPHSSSQARQVEK